MLERVCQKGKPLELSWGCKWIRPLWRTVWTVLKTLELKLPYHPETALLGIYPEKTITEKDMGIPIRIAQETCKQISFMKIPIKILNISWLNPTVYIKNAI